MDDRPALIREIIRLRAKLADAREDDSRSLKQFYKDELDSIVDFLKYLKDSGQVAAFIALSGPEKIAAYRQWKRANQRNDMET